MAKMPSQQERAAPQWYQSELPLGAQINDSAGDAE